MDKFLHIVDSGNIYGTMNSGTVRLSNMTELDKKTIKYMRLGDNVSFPLADDNLTSKEKNCVFDIHREMFGLDNGFDGNKMFMADQLNKNGSHFEITKEYVEKNPKGWTDIDEDILVIKSDVPGVVIGHPVADCPVVMMSDEKKGIAAVGHCSAEMIDRKLPNMIAKCLVENYNSDIDNIRVFVGSCAGNNWSYDSWPKWAQDFDFWKKAIYEENGIFKIDLKKALDIQFKEQGFEKEQINFDMADTLNDNKHYSNAMGRTNEAKFGRHFEGVFYADEEIKKKI